MTKKIKKPTLAPVCTTVAEVYERIETMGHARSSGPPFDWEAWYKSLPKIEYTVPGPSATEIQAQRELDEERGREPTI